MDFIRNHLSHLLTDTKNTPTDNTLHCYMQNNGETDIMAYMVISTPLQLIIPTVCNLLPYIEASIVSRIVKFILLAKKGTSVNRINTLVNGVEICTVVMISVDNKSNLSILEIVTASTPESTEIIKNAQQEYEATLRACVDIDNAKSTTVEDIEQLVASSGLVSPTKDDAEDEIFYATEAPSIAAEQGAVVEHPASFQSKPDVYVQDPVEPTVEIALEDCELTHTFLNFLTYERDGSQDNGYSEQVNRTLEAIRDVNVISSCVDLTYPCAGGLVTNAGIGTKVQWGLVTTDTVLALVNSIVPPSQGKVIVAASKFIVDCLLQSSIFKTAKAETFECGSVLLNVVVVPHASQRYAVAVHTTVPKGDVLNTAIYNIVRDEPALTSLIHHMNERDATLSPRANGLIVGEQYGQIVITGINSDNLSAVSKLLAHDDFENEAIHSALVDHLDYEPNYVYVAYMKREKETAMFFMRDDTLVYCLLGRGGDVHTDVGVALDYVFSMDELDPSEYKQFNTDDGVRAILDKLDPSFYNVMVSKPVGSSKELDVCVQLLDNPAFPVDSLTNVTRFVDPEGESVTLAAALRPEAFRTFINFAMPDRVTETEKKGVYDFLTDTVFGNSGSNEIQRLRINGMMNITAVAQLSDTSRETVLLLFSVLTPAANKA